MGHIAESYFEDLEECPYCKGKKFRAEILVPTIFYCEVDKDGGKEFWESEDNYNYNEEVAVFCDNCGKKMDY